MASEMGSRPPSMRTLVIIPTYNEAATIVTVLARIRAAVPTASVLVVDDGSPDGTAEIVERVASAIGQLHVVRRAAKLGLGSAYREGFAWGLTHGFDVQVEMDADLSHDPHELPRLLAAVDAGADLAVGSRYVQGGSIPQWRTGRRLLSRFGNRYAARALRLGLYDATSGYRAYRSDALRQLDLGTTRADGYGFQIEMAWRVSRGGGQVVEVPITFVDRREGQSKMSWRIVVEALALVSWWGLCLRVNRGVAPSGTPHEEAVLASSAA